MNLYHAGLLAAFLERLQKTADGDGSLLDHSLVLYGSGMGNGNVHAADHLPTLLVGGCAGAMKGNRHIVAPERTPNGNMLVSVAEKMGVNMDSFGSSTGRVASVTFRPWLPRVSAAARVRVDGVGRRAGRAGRHARPRRRAPRRRGHRAHADCAARRR